MTFFLCIVGYAQKRTISGTVTDKDLKEPLIGVNVLLKGTQTGTVTDMDGNYTIDVEGDGTLVFSYVSMKTVEESINGRSTINVRCLQIQKLWKKLLSQRWVLSVNPRL